MAKVSFGYGFRRQPVDKALPDTRNLLRDAKGVAKSGNVEPIRQACRFGVCSGARVSHVQGVIAAVLQDSTGLTGTASTKAAGDLITEIVKSLKKEGRFTLPSFGTFIVRKTKARKGLNPRTGEAIKVKAGKTVRFKASPTLKTKV